jgi:hypothetical protein
MEMSEGNSKKKTSDYIQEAFGASSDKEAGSYASTSHPKVPKKISKGQTPCWASEGAKGKKKLET